jgi:hypothetical protein
METVSPTQRRWSMPAPYSSRRRPPLDATEFAGLAWKEPTGSNLWAFLEPFDGSLWFMCALMVAVAAVVLAAIESIWTPATDVSYKLTPPKFATVFYHMLALQIGDEEYE